MDHPAAVYAEDVERDRLLNLLRQLNDAFIPIDLSPIFDTAPLECLCVAAGMPRFNHDANQYFGQYFRGKTIWLGENIRLRDEYLTHFRGSLQQIRVCGTDQPTFNYVALNFPNLTKITFDDKLHQNLNVPPERADILNETMRLVQIVVFNVHQFKGPFFDRLLPYTQNMRILIINSSSTQPNLYDCLEVDESRWYAQTYGQLTTVQWDDGIVSNPLGFKRLLKQNPRIDHLIFTRNICLAMDFIDEYVTDRQLNRLDVKITSADKNNIQSICNRLNFLFENGRFTQLYITCNNREVFYHRHGLNTLRGLKSITYNGEYISAIERFSGLVDLRVKSMDDGSSAAYHLIRLHSLCVNRASIDAIRPFICEVPQITKIVIRNVNREPLDSIGNLVGQRRLLPNVQRLKLYLEEWAYCMLKRMETAYSRKWLIIRRVEELLN